MRRSLLPALLVAALAGVFSTAASAPAQPPEPPIPPAPSATIDAAVDDLTTEHESITEQIRTSRAALDRLPVVAVQPSMGPDGSVSRSGVSDDSNIIPESPTQSGAAQEFIPQATVDVAIAGPEQVTSGGFALVGSTGEPAAVLRWRISKPAGAGEPLRLRDDTGHPVLVFMSPAAGRYAVTLTAQVPADGLDPFGEASHVVTVGGPGPVPPGPDPPGPDPPVPPDPEPEPPPVTDLIPGSGFQTLIIGETAEIGQLPSAQQAVLFSTLVRAELAKGTWRLWDDDYTDEQLEFAPADFKAGYLAALKAPGFKTPWIITESEKGGFSGPMPVNVNEAVDLLKKYAPN